MASTVPNGTRFLVKLEDKLSTKKHKVGKKFKAKTLEPLATVTGLLLPPGAEIRGHVSRVEPAGLTGRARIWLSFDEIKTRDGKVPLLADVRSVPGEHSVRAGDSKEGEIEARTSAGQREIEAAAAGAAIGAVVGAAAKGGKGAAAGAAIGAASGFLIASGIGTELELQKGTKLELELTRPLYLASR
jgi:type IV secretion system protein VirB10